jgi:hypothetical protein
MTSIPFPALNAIFPFAPGKAAFAEGAKISPHAATAIGKSG